MTLIRVGLLLLVIAALLLGLRPADSIAAAFVARAADDSRTFDYRLANDYLRLALTREPWNATLYLRLSAMALEQHRFDEAAQDIDQAERLGAPPIMLAVIRAELADDDLLVRIATAGGEPVVVRIPGIGGDPVVGAGCARRPGRREAG